MDTQGVPIPLPLLPVQASCLRYNGFHRLPVPLGGDRSIHRVASVKIASRCVIGASTGIIPMSCARFPPITEAAAPFAALQNSPKCGGQKILAVPASFWFSKNVW